MTETKHKSWKDFGKDIGKLKVLAAVLGLSTVSYLVNFWLSVRRIRNRKKPLGYRDFQPYPINSKEPILNNHFSPKKVQDMLKDQAGRPGSMIDYIVIGSGMGGLTFASLLSRLGYKCLVLEQHDRAGGCMHVYNDKGFEFDTGIHYVGRWGYSRAVQALQHPDHGSEFARMGSEKDGFTFDRVHLPSNRIIELKPRPLLYSTLKKEFPGEEAAIDRFEKLIKKSSPLALILHGVKALSISYWFPSLPWLTYVTVKLFYPWLFKSVYDVVIDITNNKDLQAVLVANFGNIGYSPKSTMFSLFADMFNHYWRNGGFYPIGGPGEIASGMIPVIQRAGGKVLVKAKVSEILIRQGKARGVAVKKGSVNYRIECTKGVISSAGLVNTWKLIPVEHHHNLFAENPTQTDSPSSQHLSIFLGFRGDQNELKLRSSNNWHVRHIDDDFEKGYENPLEAEQAVALVGFPSAKDPSYNDRVPGRSVGVIITTVKYGFFEKWRSQKVGKRDGEYQILKQEVAEKVLKDTIWKTNPELKDRLEYMDVGTPLSTAYYLNSFKGSSYGLEWCGKRYYDSKYRARTKIPGLFLTGQDTFVPGWAGAFYSGVLTANTCLGYDDFPHAYSDSNILKEVMTLLPKLTSEDFPTA